LPFGMLFQVLAVDEQPRRHPSKKFGGGELNTP
jgi:hypothetical protein